ncbi:MAG: malonic semialdehyde reductase [Pseudomonadota bacterium]|mgnify:FL=1|nr:malonic semialdehyde reductase [Pseudomonadota bacterium]MEC7830347.1 malonic semialdehyde reductase [Pseudomonadota bacterium]MEC9481231.1 malonic semialdehyde reductase [Pseudomonadota bacterium]
MNNLNKIKDIFVSGRTHNDWIEKDVPDSLLHELYNLMKWGPTSANCSPARITFIKSKESKERLVKYLIDSNIEKTISAPVTAIIAYDTKFFEFIPKLFPHNPEAKEWFSGSEEFAEITAFRNSSLQGAYFILAARTLGLDCGPMSGFDNIGLDNEFFSASNFKSNFICNIGYGDHNKLFDRSPRFDFDDVCKIL